MMEVEMGGKTYKIGRLNAFAQMYILKRAVPVRAAYVPGHGSADHAEPDGPRAAGQSDLFFSRAPGVASAGTGNEDDVDVDWVCLPGGEDWLLRPVLRGLCRYESLKDGTLDLADIALMHDARTVQDAPARRYLAALKRKDA